jgi:hypothetical protein
MRWPIRRRLVGGIEGRQACAAGIGFSHSPGGPLRKMGKGKGKGEADEQLEALR